MQKEKTRRPFFKYWKYFKSYGLRIQKVKESHNKVIRRILFFFSVSNSKTFVLRKIITYAFSGFSIILIGYVLMNILTNYPPREIGINP
jgi:hypothetical protein